MGYVERCLWEYRENKDTLELMREELKELSSLHGQDYKIHTSNGVSDPVSDVTHRVMRLEEKIAQVEKLIKPVDKLKASLCGSDIRTYHMREILKLKYFGHENSDVVMRKMGISDRTYFRRCGELKRLARKYIREYA